MMRLYVTPQSADNTYSHYMNGCFNLLMQQDTKSQNNLQLQTQAELQVVKLMIFA